MRIIGCDLHAAQQTLALLDPHTGEVTQKTLRHEGEMVRDFYATLPAPVVVGIEATGSMGWFLQLMDELGVTCQVGHPAAIRKAETRRQKHDRRDAALLLQLLIEERFPTIWMPSSEQREVRALLLHRHPDLAQEHLVARVALEVTRRGVACGMSGRSNASVPYAKGPTATRAVSLRPEITRATVMTPGYCSR